MLDHLPFEEPIFELQAKIDELRRVGADQDLNLTDEIEKLEKKHQEMTSSVFSSLTPHQIVSLARHPLRPHSLDYIERIFTDFDELHGDRNTDKGKAVIGGLAKLDGQPVMVIGQEKGRATKEKLARNFGMSTPEGFRKALRLMKMAERFNLPVFTFIDTPGAYPGMTAEERNQSEAIARNLFEMTQLKTPIICTVIGEGCSGGALALGVGDKLLMLQYAYYSVISPEGCASILWKSAEKAPEAAEALNLTASRLLELSLVDEVLPEPLGSAHRDVDSMSATIKANLIKNLKELQKFSTEDLLELRYKKWTDIGK